MYRYYMYKCTLVVLYAVRIMASVANAGGTGGWYHIYVLRKSRFQTENEIFLNGMGVEVAKWPSKQALPRRWSKFVAPVIEWARR